MLAYFDCFSGASGDMFLGAFVDLGVPVKWLRETLKKIPLSNFGIDANPIYRMGIRATNLKIDFSEDSGARHYSDIRSMISGSPFSDRVKNLSFGIFQRIAEAEAEIHGCPIGKVHFHEVGCMDSIIDIVGTALCVEYLGIERALSSPVPLGSGFVKCMHGTLPVPAPATLAVLKGIPVHGGNVPHEMTTPTGAAIIAELSESYGPIPDMEVEKTGYGAGKREIESTPNLLRIVMGNSTGQLVKDRIVIVETCIDDMNPEIFGYLMDRLFKDGALDVCWIPVCMKKNRPGTLVQIVCADDRREAIVGRILSETTSLGVRYYPAERTILHREIAVMKTSFGEVAVKKVRDPGGRERFVPEFEACKKLAVEKNIPIRTVYEAIVKESK